jgi:hypothetical protein
MSVGDGAWPNSLSETRVIGMVGVSVLAHARPISKRPGCKFDRLSRVC